MAKKEFDLCSTAWLKGYAVSLSAGFTALSAASLSVRYALGK
ncbi:MAG TPA: hypothetical protein PKU68_02355 [Bacillota bacterium]|nr:hypothetical protein [Bacillota bacterium]